jgi:hypothetical protein
MDTLAAILSLVTPEVYTASIDLEYLKHAYYTIPIAEEQRKFLQFVWNEQLYEFCVLPMGLTSSPRIFTKVMKPVMKPALFDKKDTLTVVLLMTLFSKSGIFGLRS